MFLLPQYIRHIKFDIWQQNHNSDRTITLGTTTPGHNYPGHNYPLDNYPLRQLPLQLLPTRATNPPPPPRTITHVGQLRPGAITHIAKTTTPKDNYPISGIISTALPSLTANRGKYFRVVLIREMVKKRGR